MFTPSRAVMLQLLTTSIRLEQAVRMATPITSAIGKRKRPTNNNRIANDESQTARNEYRMSDGTFVTGLLCSRGALRDGSAFDVGFYTHRTDPGDGVAH